MDFILNAIELIEEYNLNCLDRYPDERIGWDSECEMALNRYINTELGNMTEKEQKELLNVLIEMNTDHDEFISDMINEAFMDAPKCGAVQEVVRRMKEYATSSPFSKCPVGDINKQVLYNLKQYFDKSKVCEEVIYTLEEIQSYIENPGPKANDSLYELFKKLQSLLTSSIFENDEDENK